MNRDQETLGRYLIRERELRRVSAEEIALRMKTERRFIDALENDDFDVFTGRADAAAVLTMYAACLNVDRAEALRRFALQWKLAGGVKRYPKLTHFTDEESSAGRSVAFKVRGLFAGYPLMRRDRLLSLIGVLVAGFVLFMYLIPVLQERAPETSPPRHMQYTVPLSADRFLPPDAGSRSSEPIAAAPDLPRIRPARPGEKPASSPKNTRIVGNRDSKRYHLPGMKYYDKVKEYHRVVFQSEREAISAGYTKARQ